MTFYFHEMKMNRRNLIIWMACVGGMCMGCILLYTSLADSVQDIASSFSDMGAMSAALGMDKMSIATLRGYYATEIAMLHGLGGAMFAALLGTGLLAKEESGHTAEFLYTLPVGRGRIVLQKYLALLSNIFILNVVCAALYFLGFALLAERMDTGELLRYHTAAILMQIEIGTICFAISAFMRRSAAGAGLGITVVLFAADIMCRIIPAIEGVKYLTPFYYANAADIFADGRLDAGLTASGVLVTAACLGAAWIWYGRKDLR